MHLNEQKSVHANKVIPEFAYTCTWKEQQYECITGFIIVQIDISPRIILLRIKVHIN